jgi:malate dehydrogenase (oxaloacetate-decarboxylating)(NADP+)
MGPALPVHVVSPSITVRGVINMTAVAVVDAHAAVESGRKT